MDTAFTACQLQDKLYEQQHSLFQVFVDLMKTESSSGQFSIDLVVQTTL